MQQPPSKTESMSAIIEIKQRDEEFYQAYRKAFQQPGITHKQAIQLAIHTPTSRYWVSSSYVYRDILSRIRGYAKRYDPSRRCNKHHPCKSNMYDELFAIYKRLSRQRYFQGCSVYFIVSFVINSPAPRFYIGHCQAQRIITQKRKEARAAAMNRFHRSMA